METIIRRVTNVGPKLEDAAEGMTREWLVTNGLGGYASGTLGGVVTRRYHGILIAALAAPLGRTVMLSEISERLKMPDGRRLQLGGLDRYEKSDEQRAMTLREFRLEWGLPVWEYDVEGVVIERRLLMPYLQNTTHVSYRLVSGADKVSLRLRPAVHFRPHEAPVGGELPLGYSLQSNGGRLEVSGDPVFPVLRMKMDGATFTIDPAKMEEVVYPIEESRGYEYRGSLYSLGQFNVELEKGKSATLVASTEAWEIVEALNDDEAQASELRRRSRMLNNAPECLRKGAAAELVFAADQFIFKPIGRPADAARAHAAGDEIRSVIAGYHWFTDWGRDTMISLEGLTLTTGRHREAEWILRTFAYYVRNGLIPNMFPEGQGQGLYHTADATLWFFHAIDRYIEVTGDRSVLNTFMPKLMEIYTAHMNGTLFNIGVDPKDGLLRQGKDGYQLTWMDAKVDNWVVTPRRGKAVEINALWYNALRLLEGWLIEGDRPEDAQHVRAAADKVWESFNRRFWNERERYLYDVVDGEDGKDDPACRPNQIFSFALKNPVLEKSCWEPVLKTVHDKLLTPVGLRSLSREHPDYKAKYFGDLRARDAAYHQGTVWAWLIGPFIDAWLKVYPEDKGGARRLLEGCMEELNHACVGSISEVFDAEAPYTPRGCIAQAWSIAEVLRCWAKVSGC